MAGSVTQLATAPTGDDFKGLAFAPATALPNNGDTPEVPLALVLPIAGGAILAAGVFCGPPAAAAPPLRRPSPGSRMRTPAGVFGPLAHQQETNSLVDTCVGSAAITVGVCSEEDKITDEDASSRHRGSHPCRRAR